MSNPSPFLMASSKSEDFLHRPHIIALRYDKSKSCSSILQSQERDLPPLPDGDVRANEVSQSNPRTYSTNPLEYPTPLIGTPTRHGVKFPTYKPRNSSLTPKLRLETGWNPAKVVHIPSSDDVSSASCKSSLQEHSCPVSTTSEEHLLHFPPEYLSWHHAPAIQDGNASRIGKPPTPQPRSANCRLLSGVRLPKLSSAVRTAHKKAQTTRAINQHNNTIISKPFIRSDGSPSEGIIVTVHRQRLVSEPMTFSTPSSISLVSVGPSMLSASSEKPLPTPEEHLTKDLPAVPPSDNDHPEIIVSTARPDAPNASDSESESTVPFLTPPTTVRVGRQAVGTKRRKHYRVSRVPVPNSA
ncbi:hypothetical protein B0H11DRAFT_114121 [Mycena galericulata]|nr:hypothetical protein B0H11DRAFT_114121 [Mycena galericulata]